MVGDVALGVLAALSCAGALTSEIGRAGQVAATVEVALALVATALEWSTTIAR